MAKNRESQQVANRKIAQKRRSTLQKQGKSKVHINPDPTEEGKWVVSWLNEAPRPTNTNLQQEYRGNDDYYTFGHSDEYWQD